MSTMQISPEDERSIRALVFRYAYAVSRADPESLAAAWSKDCRLELAGVTGDTAAFEGRETVVAYQAEHMGRYEALIQLVGEGLVWAGPDGPEGRWIVWEVGRWAGAANDRMGVVMYSDRYLKEDGRWVIGERHLKVHYNNPGLAVGTYAPLPSLPL